MAVWESQSEFFIRALSESDGKVKDNVWTFRLLQQHLQLDLDKVFYMGEMSLLQISCDTGWSDLAREPRVR